MSCQNIYLKLKCMRITIKNYRIGGIFRGENFSQISRFKKNYTQKTKNLYGSHLNFDQFAKF